MNDMAMASAYIILTTEFTSYLTWVCGNHVAIVSTNSSCSPALNGKIDPYLEATNGTKTLQKNSSLIINICLSSLTSPQHT